MDFLRSIINYLNIPSIGVKDVIEIIVIAVVFYEMILWMYRTRAWRLLRGFLVILIVYLLVNLLKLNTLVWLLNKTLSVGIFALIVILQPELRRILEQLGSKGIFSRLFNIGSQHVERAFSADVVNEIVAACESMSEARTGALICIERNTALTDIERTGIKVDAVVSSSLLINIFEHNTPLHDGAAIIKGDRVSSATCYLPLSDNLTISKNLGTRHRAAVGLSEVSDAWTVVVSEETGNIRIARDGELTGRLNLSQLRDELIKLAKEYEPHGIMDYFRRQKDAG